MTPLVRRLALCACALGGFLAMAAALHRLIPLKVPEVTPKLDFLAAHRTAFDTLFIGSSRVYHGISPRVFDAATAAAGSPTHSFNLAVNAMLPPESFRLLDKALAIGLPRLRTIFMEVSSAAPNPDPANLTIRDFYSQDAGSLRYGLRRALQDLRTLPPPDRVAAAWSDFTATFETFARNQFNIGRLDLTAMPERLGQGMLGPDRDGYMPERHALTEGSRVTLANNLAIIRSGNAIERPADPLNASLYTALRDQLAARGIALVLISAPSTLRDYHAWVDAPPGPRLLRFDDPAAHPELYAPEHRLDSDHLNDDGAHIFTRELAEAYLSGK